MTLRIAARAGVAVPIPGASDPGACFQHPDRKAQAVAQAEQLIETGESRADNQRVEGTCLTGFAFRCRSVTRGCHPIPQLDSFQVQYVLSRSGGVCDILSLLRSRMAEPRRLAVTRRLTTAALAALA